MYNHSIHEFKRLESPNYKLYAVSYDVNIHKNNKFIFFFRKQFKNIKIYSNINVFCKKTFLWKNYRRICYLRQYGFYQNLLYKKNDILYSMFVRFSLTLRYNILNTIKKYNHGVFDWKSRFFRCMINLRINFKHVLMKSCKKHHLLKNYIKKQNIVEHPSILSGGDSIRNYSFFKKPRLALLYLPIPIVNITPLYLHIFMGIRWHVIRNFIKYRFRPIERQSGGFDKYYQFRKSLQVYDNLNEGDWTAGANIKIFSKYRNVNFFLFWPIYIKVLYWRLYLM